MGEVGGCVLLLALSWPHDPCTGGCDDHAGRPSRSDVGKAGKGGTGEHADQADDRQRVAAVPRASWRSATAATTPHAAALVPTLQAVRLVQRQVAVTHGR